MPALKTDSLTLHYQTYGNPNRQPIIFINALGTDIHIWDKVSRRLDDFFVILYDKRGHGLSDTPGGPYTISDHAQDLLNLITGLGIEEVLLYGVSVGGMIALGLADLLAGKPQYQNLVCGMIFSNTCYRLGNKEAWNTRIEAIKIKGMESMVESILQKWFAPDYSMHNPEMALWRNRLLTTPKVGYLATCEAIRDADYSDRAHQLNYPALCLAGEHDGSTPVEVVKKLSDALKVKLQVIQAGHIPAIDAPEKVMEVIRSFYRSSL